MKRTKRTLTLLLTAVMLSACLLPFAGCKKTSNAEDHFDDAAPSQSDKGSPPDSNTGIDSNNPHGEKILYGKLASSESSILRFGDMLIGKTNYGNKLGYFSVDTPDDARLICFDPLCQHFTEDCPAVTNLMTKDGDHPNGMYLDLYENNESPVIYFYYLRDSIYSISAEESGTRDPVYCIERYDMSQGKRYAIIDNVENTIVQACNYGDYVYYILDVSTGDKQMQKLCRVHKTGTDMQEFDLNELPEIIAIVDVVDDKLYYTVNERYVYRANLDLTGSEIVLDMSDVKGTSGSNGVIQGSYSGYLYYLADFETVWAGTPEVTPSTEKANLYRIPMNDLTKAPEQVVEGMIGTWDCFRFTEKTLYYVPCVYIMDESEGGDTAINTCDGKLFALDLKTGESKTIVEDSGMTIYPDYAWDDMVVFSGWAYNLSGKRNSGDGSNLLIAYASGNPYEIWCQYGALGVLTDEYLENLREQVRAAGDQ